MTQKVVSQLVGDYFSHAVVAFESPRRPGTFLLPSGAVDHPPPLIPEGGAARWDGEGFVIESAGGQPDTPDQPLTPDQQTEKDLLRYMNRAQVKDRLIAEMAAENMGRVRSGEWTVAQLVELASDPVLMQVQGLLGTLSFELAAQALQASTNPLLTPTIKAGWIAKLQANFFLG